ncbi:MAG: SIS domain-containing protein [Oscillospiraceae bacterium]|nr:SIS domain-containing protein [Oscillospiraceae bacterium]
MEYYSHEEIHKQYISLGQTLEYILENENRIVDFFSGGNSNGDIVFLACGSSYWMSLSAHKTMKFKTGRRSYAVKASEAVLCPGEFCGAYDNPVFVCPSRSGRTQELLDAVDVLKSMYPNSRVLSIVEYADNELAKKSDLALNIDWANEKSVCQTRSFSNLYAACAIMAALVGGDRPFVENFREYLKVAPSLYLGHEAKIREIADASKVKSIVTLGSGLQYGVTVEGAYIVIEMAQFDANYFQLLEYRHGPIVTAKPGTAAFICSGGHLAHERKIAEEIRASGAKVYAVAPLSADWADYAFSLGGDYEKEIVALHFAFVMQSFAYHFALSQKKDPDNPGNLVPYIIY